MKNLPYGGDRNDQNSARTNRVLGRKEGGRVQDKGDTHISISVGAPPTPQMRPPVPPIPTPAPAAPPPAAPAGGMAPPGLGMGGAKPPMGLGLKTGGRVPKMDAGAGSGEGRLEKAGLDEPETREGRRK